MIRKFLIGINNVELAMKYHIKTGVLEIGGNTRHITFLEELLRDYWGVKRVNDPVPTAKNKLRFCQHMNRPRFEEGVRQLELNHFAIEEVRSLGRVMR